MSRPPALASDRTGIVQRNSEGLHIKRRATHAYGGRRAAGGVPALARFHGPFDPRAAALRRAESRSMTNRCVVVPAPGPFHAPASDKEAAGQDKTFGVGHVRRDDTD
ncbi:hypothetical protein EVAR_23188_1 [Eumeta japonica]|uniref:Uncharacterized protein n=1 Tax=Eumeta variegata TaxID=151549 RepID=A0A4C1VDJ8_EUMVA|nr:hypothetical protein EVAR_23188_1 [Eumeta japonica]